VQCGRIIMQTHRVYLLFSNKIAASVVQCTALPEFGDISFDGQCNAP
jgi:hypothetical protein